MAVKRTALRDLVDEMPSIAQEWLNEAAPTVNFDARPRQIPDFVWPDVEVGADESDSPVVLVQSSGAMGKTSAALATAERLRAPYIDLAHTPVAAGSFTGIVKEALGWAGGAALNTEVRSGRRAIIIDGLDEAQLRVGREIFLKFLENVLDFVDPGGVSQIILFGRHDAIETAYLAFSTGGCTPRIDRLLPFSRTGAFELIDRTLDSDSHYSVHRQHREPWERLRDSRFDALARALMVAPIAGEELDGPRERSVVPPWDAVAGFLGYAPVVLAMAQDLKDDNPELALSEAERQSSPEQRSNQGGLLRRVIDDIVDREQKKVARHLCDALDLDPQSDGRLIYTAEEQIVRLISAMTGFAFSVVPPQSVAEEKRSRYEELIEPWVIDHPFLRDRVFSSVVFQDFVRAFVATSQTAEVFGVRRSELIGACGSVGPFFAHFVHALSAPDAVGFGQIEDEDLIDDLIRSNVIGSIGTPVAVYFHRGESAQLHIGEYEAARPSLRFVVVNPSGVAVLRAPLSNLAVDSGYGVVVEATEGRLDLGPTVMLLAEDLELGGKRFSAYSSGEDTGVVIFAGTVSHAPEMTVNVYGERGLELFWKDPSYQWRQYALKPVAEPLGVLVGSALGQLLYGIRRLLTGFRSGGDPWMYYERYDNFVVGGSPLLTAVRDRLIEIGVIERTAERYVMSVDRLSAYGVGYAGLNSADWQEALRQLAIDVAKSSEVMAALGH